MEAPRTTPVVEGPLAEVRNVVAIASATISAPRKGETENASASATPRIEACAVASPK